MKCLFIKNHVFIEILQQISIACTFLILQMDYENLGTNPQQLFFVAQAKASGHRL